MKAGFYGRQSVLSTRDDERRDLYTSTDWQVIDGHAWVRRQGGEIVRTYRDEGISGYTGALRPEFERLLIDVDDRVIDTIVCWKLDRLARNHRDFERLWDACGRRGARLVSLQETFDSSTPAGEFTIRMLAGMAKMESDNISVRVKRALEAFRQAGRMHTGGARPFGHRWDGSLVEDEAKALRWAAEQFITGRSVNAVTGELAADGVVGTKGKPLGRREVKRMVTSPRVAGLVEYQGEVVGNGTWEPILDRPTWEQVRAILLDPARGTQVGRPPKYLLVGWLRCGMEGCGAKLVSRPLTSHGRTKPNYVCVATGKLHLAIAAQPVEELVTERVLDRLDRTGLVKVLAVRGKANDSRELAEQLARDDAAFAQLGDDFYRDGIIDRPTSLRQRAALEPRIARARAELARRMQQQELIDVPAMPGKLRAWWGTEAATLEKKRSVLALVLDHAIVLPASRPSRFVDPARVVIPEDGWRA
jgi:DNA invertase Pin-like site-specific DNA recombinase